MNTVQETDERAEYVAAVRALLDVIEMHPSLPLPTGGAQTGRFVWNVWPHETDDVPGRVAEIRRMLPGTFAKNDPAAGDYNSAYYTLTAQWRGLTLEIRTYRDQVCERVVTGQREVTTEVPTATETVTVTEDIVEWRCHPLLVEDRVPESVSA